VIRSERERILVSALIENILGEYDQQQEYNKHLIQQLVNTIITVVAKNVFASISTQNCNKENNAYNIINYIHTNIYEPEKLRADHLAAHFHISPNYISEYFKKETGENLQQYIINYKLSLVATRLKHSDMRLNEIAFELGFSDESHLTKLFRKYRGITPAAYRKLSH
jgi:AraC-like DNA-binding protein